jgi:uncharacterized protein YjbJ (UPF0337 family)
MWTKNERTETADQAKGRVKQAAGALTGNADLRAEGLVEEAKGKIKVAVGRARRTTGSALTRAGKAVKR